jgi:hypothetical protein
LKSSALPPVGSSSSSQEDITTVRKRTEGGTVSFVGFDENGAYFPVKSLKNKNATMLTLKAFENLCADWFGMKVRRRASEKDRDPDLYVTPGYKDLARLCQQALFSSTPPFLRAFH